MMQNMREDASPQMQRMMDDDEMSKMMQSGEMADLMDEHERDMRSMGGAMMGR
jgi:hypothetical protein